MLGFHPCRQSDRLKTVRLIVVGLVLLANYVFFQTQCFFRSIKMTGWEFVKNYLSPFMLLFRLLLLMGALLAGFFCYGCQIMLQKSSAL